MLRSRVLPWLLGLTLAGVLGPGTAALSQSAPAQAGQTSQTGQTGRAKPIHLSGQYKGVCPGTKHTPPVARTVRGNAITWPGFQVLPQGGSRIFVQSTSPVGQRLERQAGLIIVHLGAAKLAHDNNARPLVTHFFNTPVEEAAVRVRGGQASLVLRMRAGATAVTPTLRAEAQEGTGLHFLYVDFPAGQYFAAPSVSKVAVPGSGAQATRPSYLEGNVSAGAEAEATDRGIDANGEVKAKASGSVGF